LESGQADPDLDRALAFGDFLRFTKLLKQAGPRLLDFKPRDNHKFVVVFEGPGEGVKLV
jgi:hypothetical protein